MSLPPEFKSSIPSHLLENSSERDKYIIEQLSIIGQKSDWLIGETQAQSLKLETLNGKVTEVDKKLLYTNGKVASTLKDLEELKRGEDAKAADWMEMKQIITVKQFIQKYLLNKYTLIATGIFLVGCLKVLSNSELREILFKLLGFA